MNIHRNLDTVINLVLVSPTPIRILCVFGRYEALRVSFRECADKIFRLNGKCRMIFSNTTIETPGGSQLIFKCIGNDPALDSIKGYILHHAWIEDGHPMHDLVTITLNHLLRRSK